MDEFVLLCLRSDDFEQRPVLVKEQIRIPVAQNARALCCEHESLFMSVCYVKCPNLELTIP